MNLLEKYDLEIGSEFKKSSITLVLLRIERGIGIFQRSYRGKTRIIELIPINHVISCNKIYQKVVVQ